MSPRRLIKRLTFLAAAVLCSPLIVFCMLEKALAGTTGVYSTCAQLLAIAPGPPGAWLRSAFYWGALDDCSWETHIGFGSIFMHRQVRVDANVSTGAWCVFGHVHIGARTRFASRVSIPSGRRQHLDEEGRLSDITRYDPVTIGEDCWIGEAVTILADVGARSIVGAGAVVIRPMPSDKLISGNPAAAVRALNHNGPIGS